MSTEADNDTQFELAAWELLKEARQELADYKASAERARDTITQAFLKVAEERDEARELARELRDALALVVSWWDKVDRGTDEIEESEVNTIAFEAAATLTKAKEVLP